MRRALSFLIFFFFQAEDGIRDRTVTGVQTCALPISWRLGGSGSPVHFFQSLAFGFNIGSRIDIGRVEACMSKPATNHCHVHFCRDKTRSEERRVGKECRARWWPKHELKRARTCRYEK